MKIARKFKITVSVMAMLLVGFTAIAWFEGPHSKSDTHCMFCGRHRFKESRLGIVISDRITETPSSQWADQICPEPHQHKWANIGCRSRGWFDGYEFGCGGPPGAATIYGMRKKLGEETAVALLKEFRAKLSKAQDVDSFIETKEWLWAQLYQDKENNVSPDAAKDSSLRSE